MPRSFSCHHKTGLRLPDISELNGTAIANVAEFGGLTVTSAPAGTFLLDTTYGSGAAAAYSTRKLKAGVTVAARIRRSGDNIEADVEFDTNNEISLTSPISNASSGTYTDLADFVDHTGTARDAFVKEWKDQSGNANHAAQATPGIQPQLYDATTGLITDGGKPCVKFTRSGTTGLLTPSTSWSTAGAMQFFMVFNDEASTGNQETWSNASNRMFTGAGLYMVNTAAGNLFYTSSKIADQNLFVYEHNSTARTVYIDGTQDVTSASPANVSTTSSVGALGRRYNASEGHAVVLRQELIHYPVNQSTNRTDIEQNINSDYLIYQPTTAPTSGFLYDYGSGSGGTDAAAAYSVRQLSDKAVICMRIRRDSDDEELNIGFDSNGLLDTQAISDFCDTANGYVTRWWDQSTNGNHADQPVGGTGSNGSQPHIYNGTEVITRNSKPALYFNQDKLAISSVSWGATRTIFTVLEPVAFDAFNPIFGTRDGSGNFAALVGTTGNYKMQQYPSGSFNNRDTGVAITTDQQLIYTLFDGTGSEIGKDASTAVSVSLLAASAENHSIASRGTDTGAGEFYMQEHVVYVSDESSNRTGIETNIDNYFQIPGM